MSLNNFRPSEIENSLRNQLTTKKAAISNLNKEVADLEGRLKEFEILKLEHAQLEDKFSKFTVNTLSVPAVPRRLTWRSFPKEIELYVAAYPEGLYTSGEVTTFLQSKFPDYPRAALQSYTCKFFKKRNLPYIKSR